MDFILHKTTPGSQDTICISLDGPTIAANGTIQFEIRVDGEVLPLPLGAVFGFDCVNIVENFTMFVRQYLASVPEDIYWQNGELYHKEPLPSMDEIVALAKESLAKYPDLQLPKS